MSQVNTSVEVLLKIRQIGEELIAKTKRDMDALAATQGKAGAAAGKAAEGSAALSKSLASQDSLAIKVAENFKRLAAGYLSFATARRAIAASNEAERAELRTLGVLQAQFDTREKALKQLERYKALSRDLAGRLGVFDDDSILSALGRFSVVNPAFANERSVRAAADLAVVKFGGNLDQAAEALADSFVGIGRGLQDILPELRALSGEEQQRLLKSGGAVGLIEGRIGGSAGILRQGDLGRQLETQRLYNDSLEDAGSALKIIFTPAVFAASKALRLLASIPSRNEVRLRAAKEASDVAVLGLANRIDGTSFNPFGAPFVDGFGGRIRNLSALQGLPFDLSGIADKLRNASALQGLVLDLAFAGPPEERAPSEAPGDPRAILGRQKVSEILAGVGALTAFEEKVLSLEKQFGALQDAKGNFPFEDPVGIGAPIANATRDIDLLFNLALEREKAAQVTLDLAAAQEELNRSIARTSELVQAGVISEGAGKVAVDKAAAQFREVVAAAKAARDESALFSGEQIKRLQDLTDIALPGEPRFITDFTKALESAERAMDTLNRRAQGLSQELSKRLEQPFANLTVATAKGEAGLTDFAQTFADTLAQIAAEEASRGILRAIFGGISGATGIGSAFDALGAAFGFGGGYAHGGLVPGADRGRDTTFIAARGQEFVLTPGAARAIGHNRLDSINRAFGGRPSRGAGYSGGGLVDVVAAMGGGAGGGASGGGGLTVLPVLPTDRATIESLFGGDNALVLAELLARNPSARRALSMGGAR